MPRKLLAGMYDAVTRLRNEAYDRGFLRIHRAAVPVISIGNVTAGGNGKTPLVIFLVRELLARGRRPVVVTRGYGGTVVGPHLVGEGDRPNDVGDEPCLMAQVYGLTVVVARDRARGADFVVRHTLGDIIVLDDGFQHRRLARDIDIVAINTGTPEARAAFLEGSLLPYGRFREDRDRALRRAHIVVCAERRPTSGAQLDPAILSALPANVSVYRSFLSPTGVLSLTEPARSLQTCPVVAFCGIAQPENFFSTLEAIGFTLLDRRIFPDHHPFSPPDLDALRATFPGTPLICTEKDALKIPPSPDIYALRVETSVFPTAAFLTNIERLL